ncbi:MAG: hypothetical protein COA42_24400, partial [Alteromonadaceae bacterium]
VVVLQVENNAYPISAMLGDGYDAGFAVLNLANLYHSDGTRLLLSGGETVNFRVFGGLDGEQWMQDILPINDGQGALKIANVSPLQLAPVTDSDGDGLSDTYELAHNLDPNNAADANLDNDNDGLSNLQEYQQGTSLENVDSDGDGISDGEELSRGTLANQADSDRDGLSDFAEIYGPISTDPLNADSDNDGVNDGIEQAQGSNPNDADDTPVLDDDNDQVLNDNDNCRNIPNPNQRDTDRDGLGNACDSDDDNDGVVDALDNAPEHSNPEQLDNDGDGIGDAGDNCPLFANINQINTDNDQFGNLCDDDDDNDGINDFEPEQSPSRLPYFYHQAFGVVGSSIPVANAASANNAPGLAVFKFDPLTETSVQLGLFNFNSRQYQALPLTEEQRAVTGFLGLQFSLPDCIDCAETILTRASDTFVLQTDQGMINVVFPEINYGDGAQMSMVLVAQDGSTYQTYISRNEILSELMQTALTRLLLDNCPLVPNADQNDADLDGIGDFCDQTATDLDGDGLLNEDDNCPYDTNPEQDDNDRDGTGDSCDSDLNHDDILQGDSANNTLDGAYGNDILIGGLGDDLLFGGNGNDQYYFSPGDGNDLISNLDINLTGEDSLHLLDGIFAADIQLIRTQDNLLVSLNRSTDGSDLGSITLVNFFVLDGNSPAAIDQIVFEDGSFSTEDILLQVQTASDGDDLITGYAWAEVLQGLAGNDVINAAAGDDTLEGGLGDDTLHGQAGDDHLYGGAGSDLLDGGEGSDTYYFNIGDGSDTINTRNQLGDASDTLFFGDGITIDMVTWQVTLDERSLDIRLDTVGDRVRLNNFFLADGWAVDLIRFADGSQMTVDDVRAIFMSASDGDDELRGFSGDDTINGGLGFDRINGGDGNDILSGDADRDILRGDDGDDQLYGGDDNDQLDGGADNDRLYGGAGNDTLRGGTGSDTYIFNLGDGQDTIYNTDSGSGDYDVLYFGAGILPENVTLSLQNPIFEDISGPDNRSLMVTINTLTNDDINSVLVNQFFQQGGAGSAGFDGAISAIEFGEDGTIWTAETIFEQFNQSDSGRNFVFGHQQFSELNGLAGNDYIYGYDGDEVIIGGQGNDLLNAGGGDNIYQFNIGDGFDFIASARSSDVIRFGSGITVDDVEVLLTDTSYIVRVNTQELSTLPEDSVFEGMYVLFSDGLSMEFDNGDILAHSDIIQADRITLMNDGARYDVPAEGAAHIQSYSGYIFSVLLNGDDRDNVLLGRIEESAIMDGGLGADVMMGGNAGDLYFVDNIHDVVSEMSRAPFLSYNIGIDSIVSSVNYQLPESVENIRFNGENVSEGKGNALDNILFSTTEGIHLQGLLGDDTYVVNSSAQIFEAPNAGVDTIVILDLAEIVLSDYPNFENARAARTGATLSGDEGDNVLWGYHYDYKDDLRLMGTRANNAGYNYFVDGVQAGSQTLRSNTDFFGGAGNDTIYAGPGASDITGGPGDDLLIGGGGGDRYFYAPGDGSDRIISDHSRSFWSDVLVFDENITFDDLIFSREGDHLVIQYFDDRIVLEDHYDTFQVMGVAAIEVFDQGELLTFSRDDIDALINSGGIIRVANRIVDQSFIIGDAFNFALPENTFADDNYPASALQLQATLSNGDALPAWLNFNPLIGQFNLTSVLPERGSYELVVNATDPDGFFIADEFSLEVISPIVNTPPQISIIPPEQGTTITLADENSGGSEEDEEEEEQNSGSEDGPLSDTLLLTAQAFDQQDGDISSLVTWYLLIDEEEGDLEYYGRSSQFDAV